MTFGNFMPARIISGKNAVTENPAQLKNLGSKCLIVSGRSGALKSGALDDAKKALTSQGIGFDIYDGIGENPLLSSCHEAGCKARACGAEFILGIGGGSALDASKAIAIYAANENLSPVDIYKRVYDNPPLPVALIGTTAGTGSEVTAVAVLTNDETGIKKSIKGPDCYAAVSFCDPKYTYSLPFGITVSTALDAFEHAVEGFFTEKCENLSRVYAEKCIPDLYRCLKEMSETGDVTKAQRDTLYYGSILAGLVINDCGTAFPHPIGYVLTENYGVAHGTACAAFFTFFIDRCAEFSPGKTAAFAAMTDEIPKVKKVISSLVKIGDIDMTPELAHEYSKRWESAIPGNFTASPGSLTRELAEEYLLKACEMYG